MFLPSTGVQRGNIITEQGDPLTQGYPANGKGGRCRTSSNGDCGDTRVSLGTGSGGRDSGGRGSGGLGSGGRCNGGRVVVGR